MCYHSIKTTSKFPSCYIESHKFYITVTYKSLRLSSLKLFIDLSWSGIE